MTVATLPPVDPLLAADPTRYWTLLDAGRRNDWDRSPWLRAILRLWHEAYGTARREALFENHTLLG